VDVCNNIDEVNRLFVIAIFDFTKRVKKQRKQKAYSYPVEQCIAYILDHLHYQITLTQLSKHCGRTTQYLSTLFHKETGITIREFIMNEKLEAAKQMLSYSEAGLMEISAYLAFSTHSNFTMHFKRKFGMTPRAYRRGISHT
jgi:AraC-like DNA-binding protein